MTLSERKIHSYITKMPIRTLTEPEMEQVNGGYWIIDGCRHNFVRTGRSKEESFFIFWKHTVYEEICSKCGWSRWAY